MNRPPITRDTIIQRSRLMPSFPNVVQEILATLDDPDTNLNVLVRYINLDPVITARVLAVANTAAMQGRRDADISSIFAATSLIGLSKVRSITLISSLGAFIQKTAAISLPTSFWEHSVAISICAQELTQHVAQPVNADAALISGMLHDMGQLWLYTLDANATRACWQKSITSPLGIEAIEREAFGIDHATVGAWLAEHWKLPLQIVQAIQYHHHPDTALANPLVPLIHVAEVLGNALDLGHRDQNRVTPISSVACETLGLVLDDTIGPLFGRIEARSRHANQFFSLAR
ncbi:HDOD domain-containing protein [Rhodoferax antarcticus]|uniref:HDOD domain-containing protein n=1 Tax=Rhodoferax antarcticus TaxID=81479 RepID=UPI0022249A82|nr:HDOD domain-containing protein [Rhodoferax antarcticus]MCW2313482.1 putative nucleotidyltransferase with HDIG domain [Rhodoferax antarcticus]